MSGGETNRFDAAAVTWDDQPERRERAAKAAAAIRTYLPSDRRLAAVELGAGTGLLSFALADTFDRIVLVDSSAGMVEAARAKIASANRGHMTVRREDLAEFPAAPIACDVIYTMMSLHHVRDYRRLLGRCFQTLPAGGLLFIIDLEKEDGSFHRHIPNFDGHNGFDPELLRAQLEEMGYREIVHEKVFAIEGIVNGAVREFGLFLLKAEKPGK